MDTSVATSKDMAPSYILSNGEPFSTLAGRHQEEGPGGLIGESINRANITLVSKKSMEQYMNTLHTGISPDDSYEEEAPDASKEASLHYAGIKNVFMSFMQDEQNKESISRVITSLKTKYVYASLFLLLVQTGVLSREQIVTGTTERIADVSGHSLDFLTRGSVDALPIAPPLLDALQDLDEAREEAREEEYPQPSETAIRNARHLLPKMYQVAPQRFEVYPTPEGEIIIDAPGGYGRSVLLVCTPDGGALCLVNTSGSGDRQARYRTTDTLPDGFLREALEDMKQEDV